MDPTHPYFQPQVVALLYAVAGTLISIVLLSQFRSSQHEGHAQYYVKPPEAAKSPETFTPVVRS